MHSKTKKRIAFFITLFLSIAVMSFLLAFYYTNSLSGFRIRGRQSQHFSQEMVYSHLHDFALDGNVITSTSWDPHALVSTNVNYSGSILTIDVRGLSVSPTSAQIFFSYDGIWFTEADSVRFFLRNGFNVIFLPGQGYDYLRLDLVEAANISMVVNEVILANHIILPTRFWVIWFYLCIASVILLFFIFFKLEKVKQIRDKCGAIVEDKILDNYEPHGYSQVTGFTGLFKQSSFYWICVIITAILCYGFALTHHTIGLDTALLRTPDGFLLLGTWRWGRELFKLIFDTYYLLPFWRNFIALILIITGLTLFCGLFKKYSHNKFDDKAATIFTCVAISFPWIAHLFVFMLATIEIGLIILCAGISLYLSSKWVFEKKSILYAFPCPLLLGFALDFYELVILMFLIGAFLLVLTKTIFSKEDSNIRHFSVMAVKFSLITPLSIVVWRFGRVFVEGFDRLSHLDNYVRHDTSNVIGLLWSVFRFCVHFVYNFILSPPLGRGFVIILVWASSILLLVIGLLFAIIVKKSTLFWASLATIVSAYGVHLITGNIFPIYRTILHLFILVAFVFALIYMIFKNIEFKGIKFKYIITILMIGVVLLQSRSMNQVFYLDHLRYQQDIAMMNTIIHDLGGRVPNKPVLFVGIIPDTPPNIGLVGISMFHIIGQISPHHELFDLQVHNFFRHHGFPIRHPGQIDTNILRYRIADMPSWPNEGYIREFDDYIIIRLGRSAWG